jgi:hypothetical protein
MGRSQRHRIENQGVHSDERIGTIPTNGTYNGSHLRAGATAGANVRGRAGEALTLDGAAGAGTIIGGFTGIVGAPVSSLTHVNGQYAPVYKRPAIGNAP